MKANEGTVGVTQRPSAPSATPLQNRVTSILRWAKDAGEWGELSCNRAQLCDLSGPQSFQLYSGREQKKRLARALPALMFLDSANSSGTLFHDESLVAWGLLSVGLLPAHFPESICLTLNVLEA